MAKALSINNVIDIINENIIDKETQISYSQFYGWVKEGLIPTEKRGKSHRIKREDVIRCKKVKELVVDEGYSFDEVKEELKLHIKEKEKNEEIKEEKEKIDSYITKESKKRILDQPESSNEHINDINNSIKHTNDNLTKQLDLMAEMMNQVKEGYEKTKNETIEATNEVLDKNLYPKMIEFIQEQFEERKKMEERYKKENDNLKQELSQIKYLIEDGNKKEEKIDNLKKELQLKDEKYNELIHASWLERRKIKKNEKQKKQGD